MFATGRASYVHIERGIYQVKRVLAGLAATSIVIGTAVPMAMADTTTFPAWFNANITVGGQTLSTPGGFSENNETYLPIYYLDSALKKIGYTATWNGVTHTWNLTTSGTDLTALASLPISAGSGNTNIAVDGKVLTKINTVVMADLATDEDTTYAPVSFIQPVLAALGAGTWTAKGFTLDINMPNVITTAVATNGSVTVTFSKPLTVAPSADAFVVTGTTPVSSAGGSTDSTNSTSSTGTTATTGPTVSTIAVSKVDMSKDMMTATLTIPEIPPTSGKPVPQYSVSYMGGKAVQAYERVVAVNDGKPGEVSKVVKVGDTLTVAGVSDQCTPMPSITFQSDNTSVATVTADGTVTAVAPGVAHIMATDAKGYNANVPFTVIVQGANDPTVASVISKNGSIAVTFNSALTAAPAADEFMVTGTVDASATSGSTGTDASAGSTATSAPTITMVPVSKVAMSTDMTTATLTIPEISPTSGDPVPHYSVSFLGQTAVAGYERLVAVNDGTPGETSKTIAVGDTLTVAGVSDQCTPMPSITFQSDNTSVATVTADGTVTAIAAGTAHITATDSKGFAADVPFTVTVQ